MPADMLTVAGNQLPASRLVEYSADIVSPEMMACESCTFDPAIAGVRAAAPSEALSGFNPRILSVPLGIPSWS